MKLGLIYYNQNNDSKAMDYYTQVIDDYPGSAEAKEALLAIRDISPEAYLDRVTDASDRERDSLNYVIAEGFYRDEDCDKAIIAFDQYLDDFPKGQRVLEGYFFKGECLFKNDRFDEALGDYEFVIEAPRSVYSETALLKAARITYFKQEDFAKAINFYEQLLEITEYKDNTFEAIKGLLRSTYQLKRYNDVLRYAKDMLKEPQANQDDIITANYYPPKRGWTSEIPTVLSTTLTKQPNSPPTSAAWRRVSKWQKSFLTKVTTMKVWSEPVKSLMICQLMRNGSSKAIF